MRDSVSMRGSSSCGGIVEESSGWLSWLLLLGLLAKYSGSGPSSGTKYPCTAGSVVEASGPGEPRRALKSARGEFSTWQEHVIKIVTNNVCFNCNRGPTRTVWGSTQSLGELDPAYKV